MRHRCECGPRRSVIRDGVDLEGLRSNGQTADPNSTAEMLLRSIFRESTQTGTDIQEVLAMEKEGDLEQAPELS